MGNLLWVTILGLVLSFVSGQATNSEEQMDNFASQLIGRLERNREDCPNLPERSLAVEQVKKCMMETEELKKQLENENPEESFITEKFICKLLAHFVECSSSLVTEIMDCGKNPEIITIIGLVKGSCEYGDKNGFTALVDLYFGGCSRQPDFRAAMDECGEEEFKQAVDVEEKTIATFLDVFCPAGRIVRKCSVIALEKFCPQEFVELSAIYQSSRRLSGDANAFDICLTGQGIRSRIG